MKPIFGIGLLLPFAAFLFVVDVPPELPPTYVELVPEARAVFGVRRRSFRRGVVVGASAGAASASASATAQQQAATAQQQSATAQQQSATAQQQSATAQQQSAAAPQQSAGALPLGTVVTALPPGCSATQVSGVEYYQCGGNYYRAAFQGNNLVYVTTEPN